LNKLKFNVDAVLFDLDGTILDSIGVYFQIIETVFDRLDLDMPAREKIREAAKTGEFKWGRVFPSSTQEVLDDRIKRTQEITAKIYPKLFGSNLKLIPRAKETLEIILQRGIKVGVVTSTPRKNLTHKLAALEDPGIKDLLEVFIAADDVHRKKPAPDPLLMGSQRLDISPSQCMYVGDSRTDIQAGKAAGMKTVGVLTGIDDLEALTCEKPDAVIDSIAALKDMLL
jgi:HAD superfamily hydrolase (TIGR01662 family)